MKMAHIDTVFLAAQLKKLNKDELINLIINKNVTQITGLSEQVKLQLSAVLHSPNSEENSENGDTGIAAGDKMAESESGGPVLDSNSLILKRENVLLLKLNEQMEERLKEQSLLIHVLRQNIQQEADSKDKGVLKMSYQSKQTVIPSQLPSTSRRPAVAAAAVEGETKGPAEKGKQSLFVGSNGGNQNKPRYVRGNAEISTIPVGVRTNDRAPSFAAVARRAYLYVGNVQLQATDGMISSYLKQKFPNSEFIVESLPVKDNAQSRAFKVTFDFSLLEDLSRPEVWPSGVIIKRFFRAKSRQQ